jgi:hypothetical protein
MRDFEQRFERLRFAAIRREENLVAVRVEERPGYVEKVTPINPIRDAGRLHGDQVGTIIVVGTNGVQVFT